MSDAESGGDGNGDRCRCAVSLPVKHSRQRSRRNDATDGGKQETGRHTSRTRTHAQCSRSCLRGPCRCHLVPSPSQLSSFHLWRVLSHALCERRCPMYIECLFRRGSLGHRTLSSRDGATAQGGSREAHRNNVEPSWPLASPRAWGRIRWRCKCIASCCGD